MPRAVLCHHCVCHGAVLCHHCITISKTVNSLFGHGYSSLPLWRAACRTSLMARRGLPDCPCDVPCIRTILCIHEHIPNEDSRDAAEYVSDQLFGAFKRIHRALLYVCAVNAGHRILTIDVECPIGLVDIIISNNSVYRLNV